jgi:hypothetical protein
MQRLTSAIAVGLVLAAALPVHAQDESTPEEQAVIKLGEVGRLDPASVSKAGPITRFEASIVWDEAGGAPPQGHLSRKVRYVADCKAGMLTLAAVKVFDPTGKLIKNALVPPGAADSAFPKPGSAEAGWLKEACGR